MTTPHSERACLIINPTSGQRGLDAAEIITLLQEHGWEADVRETEGPGTASGIAQGAVGEGYTVVVGCGGDGTLSEIIEGMLGSSVALGVIPGGTVNLWANELGILDAPRQAAHQLIDATRQQIDVGQITVSDAQHHFLLMASLGLDGDVMAHVNATLKAHVGAAAVGVAGLKELIGFSPSAVRVTVDEERWYGEVSQIVVGNTRGYGGITSVTPEAHVDDGLLDLCLITATTPLDAVKQLASLVLRQAPDQATAVTYRGREITIEAPASMSVQLDGDVVNMSTTTDPLHCTIRVVPAALSVLVPRSYKGDLFEKGASG